MGADVAPERYEAPKGFSLSLQLSSAADAERIYGQLSAAGPSRRHSKRPFGRSDSAS
jgi:hypothetical protein